MSSRTPRRHRARHGVAAIECAICLPILLTLTVATIDTCSAMFLRESLTIAAYEGARAGIRWGGTDAAARARVLEFLDERGVQYDAQTVVEISNPSFDSAETLDAVSVTVSVPAQGNLLAPSTLYGGRTISARVTMRKEYENT